MIGLGTIINVCGIILSGIVAIFVGKGIKERFQKTLISAVGVSTLFLGISGTIEKMIVVDGQTVTCSGAMIMIVSMALGAVVGEIINLEDRLEQFGEWLKKVSGNAKDSSFVDAFVTCSLTVCIGAMAVVGAIEDGLTGDYSTLLAKTTLDIIMVFIMTTSLGKGAVFSAIPVLILQGTFTLFAKVIEPVMTQTALSNLSMVGSVLILCVGINILWGKKIRVANLLPAIVFAVILAFI